MKKWSVEDSRDLYNVGGWGAGYFDINKKGNIQVKPKKNGHSIDMTDLMNELEISDISPPILLRFIDILTDRIDSHFNCFERAAKEYDFKAEYYAVYPIKVNQAQPIVEEIMECGKKNNIGLEAGSKPELHAVLAGAVDSEAPIVCNGYKDEAFIKLALLAQKMGRKVFLVVEKLNELKLIIDTAQKLDVKPNIGIRIKIASGGSGKWEDSAGDKSKFGLTPSELLEAVEIAEREGLLDQIKLIHFHIGSQVTKIRMIKNALREAAQFYVQMKKLGCGIDFVDIGGGLGVDYDGTKTSNPSSVNYNLQEYANDAVFMFVDASDKNDLPHPNIIAESGRSITAHHSALVFNVLETASMPIWDYDKALDDDAHELLVELRDILENISVTNLLESWHDAQQIREEALDLFSLGLLDLKTRALIERIFWTIARESNSLSDEFKRRPDEFRNLNKYLAKKYFCNFSLFQSLPDSWAIDQIFPIIPLSRHNEKQTDLGTIQDITCDSDGKIDRFIGIREKSQTLPLHEIRKDKPYYIGIFLVGAYQEILGDMHNLFGDTNVVHVKLTKDGYKIDKVIDGETVAEVLGYVHFNPKKMVRTIESWVASSIKKERISKKEGKDFIENYRSGLYGYTYLV